MNYNISRTHPQDIKQLVKLYTRFHPQELHFLIEMNQRWSVYDPYKIQNMTAILRETFASEHEQSDLEEVIKYFNIHGSIQVFSSVTVDMVLNKLDQAYHLNPFESRCPLCSSHLTADLAHVLSVQIYTLKGIIQKGK